MILYVDDVREPGFECIIARTPMLALAELQKQTVWDEVWLDFDMGLNYGEQMDNTCIADYLEAKALLGRPLDIGRIYIHSQNPVGKEFLYRILSRYYNTIKV